MFCPNCGNMLPDDAKFCPSCGQQIGSSAQQSSTSEQTQPNNASTYAQNNTQTQTPNAQTYAQNTQTPGGFQNTVAQTFSQAQPTGQPMKWFKFLIYFGLFAGALLNLISGIMQLTGGQYGENKELVYYVFADMKTLDLIFGILLIFLAVFGVYTRFQLSSYRRSGPTCLNVLYIANIILSLAYLIAASVLTQINIVELGGSSMIISLVVSICMVVVNTIYFKKRSQLFVK